MDRVSDGGDKRLRWKMRISVVPVAGGGIRADASGRRLAQEVYAAPRLTPGVKTLQSRNFQSFTTPPWIAVCSAAQMKRGNVFFASLHTAATGGWISHKAFRRGAGQRRNQFLGHIASAQAWRNIHHAENGDWIFSRWNRGDSQRMHEYVRREVLPASFRNRLRPVIYNSWFATTFNVQEQQQVELRENRQANRCGIVRRGRRLV